MHGILQAKRSRRTPKQVRRPAGQRRTAAAEGIKSITHERARRAQALRRRRPIKPAAAMPIRPRQVGSGTDELLLALATAASGLAADKPPPNDGTVPSAV